MQNLSRNLFYLLIFLLPIQTRWIYHYGQLNGGQWEYGTMAVYATGVLLWLIILLVVSMVVKHNFQFSIFNPFDRLRTSFQSIFKVKNFQSSFNSWQGLVLILILFYIANIFTSLNKSLAIYSLLHIIEGVLILVLAIKMNLNYKKLAYAFFVSAFFQACLGIWQFSQQTIIANKWLGIAQQFSFDPGVSVVSTPLRRWLRAYGSFSHPNVLGGFLVLGFLVGAYLIINQQVENRKQLYQKIALIFGNLIILIGLLFTFSRSAWLALGVVVLVFFVNGFISFIGRTPQPPLSGGLVRIPTQPNKTELVSNSESHHDDKIKLVDNLESPPDKGGWGVISVNSTNSFNYKNLNQQQRSNFWKLLSYSLILSLIIIFIFKEVFLIRVRSEGRLEQKSHDERKVYYQEAWQVIKQRPLLGVGAGNYTLAVHDLVNSKNKSWDYQPVHNIFVLIIVEVGLVGFVFIFLIFHSLKEGNLPIGSLPSWLASPVLYLILVIFITGLFDHYWWTNYSMMLIFWLILGFIKNKQNPKTCE